MCPQESNQGSERATRELSQRGGSRGINPVSREGSQAELQAERRAFDSRPDRRKIAQSAMPFKQMENVSHYVEACSALGVPAQDLFQTVDLFEGKDMRAVVRNIHSLGRVAQVCTSYLRPSCCLRPPTCCLLPPASHCRRSRLSRARTSAPSSPAATSGRLASSSSPRRARCPPAGPTSAARCRWAAARASPTYLARRHPRPRHPRPSRRRRLRRIRDRR